MRTIKTAFDSDHAAIIAAARVAVEPLEQRQLFSSLVTLASFSGSDGAHPLSGLILSGNEFYGTTADGGAYGDGTIFSIPASGGVPTLLASFNGTDGAHPLAGLVLVGSNLYGTTSQGGAGNGDGTVFSVPVTGGPIRVLASFDGTDGEKPDGGLVVSGDTLYGTTQYGGTANGDGTVFSIPLGGGVPRVLASFDGSDGAEPYGALILSGNTLVGTTAAGVAIGDGILFSLPTSGGTPVVLSQYNTTASNGVGDNGEATQNAGLILIGSTLYVTTIDGGASGDGDVFSEPLSGGGETILASFDGSNGASPAAGLVAYDSTLFGTTENGGASGDGTVFAVSLPPGTEQIVPLTAEGKSKAATARPVVAIDPSSQIAVAGHVVKFTASITDTSSLARDVTVQWYVKKTASHKFTAIKGATSTTLDLGKVTVLQNGYEYEAVFKDADGQTTTTAATLRVRHPTGDV